MQPTQYPSLQVLTLMTRPPSELEQELLYTLNLFQNKFEPGSETPKQLMQELASFGVEISIRALQRYRVSTKSTFFSYSEIIGCVKREIATIDNIKDAKSAWGELQKLIRYSSKQPALNPILEKTVSSLGGWRYLKSSTATMADRSNFYKNYEMFFDMEMTNRILTLSNKIVK